MCQPFLPPCPLQNERGLVQSGSVMVLERELGRVGGFPWGSGKTEVPVFLTVRLWLTVAVLYFWLQSEEKEQKAPYENLFYRLHPYPNTHSSPVVSLYCGYLGYNYISQNSLLFTFHIRVGCRRKVQEFWKVEVKQQPVCNSEWVRYSCCLCII